MKEKISLGLSGLNFGHFKAFSCSDFLSAFESSPFYVPYFTGYLPTVWKKAINVMLDRKKGKVY